MRERCALVLKVADGVLQATVAEQGLLKPRSDDMVRKWYRRYRQEGLSGLLNRKGQGRKPAFFPVHRNEVSAKEALLHLVRRDPHELGFERSRWRLRDLLSRLSDWKVRTTAGVQRILKRMNIHSKRGRSYIHSPDTHYQEKLARITVLRQRVKESQGREVLLYLDECSIERQPSVGYNYEAAGSDAPHAEWKPRYNTVTLIMATLDPLSGKVVSTLIGESHHQRPGQLLPQSAASLSAGRTHLDRAG